MNPARDPLRTQIPHEFAEKPDVTAVVARAITGLRSAQPRWARAAVTRRIEILRQLRHFIAVNGPHLAEASAAARRCSVAEALVTEVIPLAEACRFLEREAKSLLSPRRIGRRGRPLWLAGVQTEVRREPHGIVLIIGPGNYPLLLPGVQLIQALVAGNAVLLKPGAGGSVVAGVLADLLDRAGLDPHLVAILPESTATARAAILSRPDKVVFTGSAETGEKILAQLAPLVIPAAMELSGCDAVILRADADLELAVKALTFGLRLNGGATCMAPKRVLVSAARATELEGRLAEALSGLSCGAKFPTADTPLPQLVQDALARGAHLIAGGVTDDGQVQLPLVLGGVTPGATLLRADIFAPVLALVTVANDHEAVLRANDCPYALAASVFSRDEAAARAIAAQLRAGVVTINDLILPAADARTPFGGRGRSGFGVTQGAEGLLEMTVPKVISVTRSKFRPAFDPLHPGDDNMFAAYLSLSYARGLTARWQALTALLKSLRRRKTSHR